MYIFKEIRTLQQFLEAEKKAGKKVGFVPTMGALHQGHISLIDAAREQSDIVVCSIFVNPTQFNDPKDYEKYPITINEDVSKLTAAGTDVLFLPAVAEMYPEGVHGEHRHYDFGYLETVLEGAHRPNHFQGVGIIVHKLLEAVLPDGLFMGQKDFQQCMIVKKLLDIIQLPVQLVICPTRREEDGLAMSSRNLRLSSDERQLATAIFNELIRIKENVNQTPLDELKQNAILNLEQQGFQVDYIEVADANNLRVISAPIPESMVALAAAKLNEVRLIDNMLL
ncbi:pantoate--beta-alanine ligase [Chitinophaga horti]|uniref:Pantothenate synthetase n=1 Tax=Chitinophaga horti TaxID=2920382 RepID=A0ABY6JAC7_9BACT|nr:pantoate--beta-alanine ligase [Chitinophaga horti]UYQ95249.1 pantoate--beta-alanine ligase [Chitinophaga horti]